MSRRMVLDALRVIEAGTTVAGLLGGAILAGLGGDVIRIEEPRPGDPMRDWSPMVATAHAVIESFGPGTFEWPGADELNETPGLFVD